MIEDHTHCIWCGKVCYYPDEPIEVPKAVRMQLCWSCFKEYKPPKKDPFCITNNDPFEIIDEPDGIEDKDYPSWNRVRE
jgi:hypothetical protein